MEHLCGRFLLQYLYPNFPIHQITPDNQDKPRLPNNVLFFSISHSWPFVAVLINEKEEAGIDIQTINPRISAIKHKFLSPTEQLLFGDDLYLLTLAWCAKEAAYKWNGRRGVPFIEELPILFHKSNAHQHQINIHIGNQRHMMLHLNALKNNDFVCAYVSHHEEWINE
jgi:phosphopantetheinyl transferase